MSKVSMSRPEMTEYEKLREEVAKKLSELDGWNRVELTYYREMADVALSMIAERCWLKDEEKGMPIVLIRGMQIEAEELERINKSAGWRPVKEIKK